MPNLKSILVTSDINKLGPMETEENRILNEVEQLKSINKKLKDMSEEEECHVNELELKLKKNKDKLQKYKMEKNYIKNILKQHNNCRVSAKKSVSLKRVVQVKLKKEYKALNSKHMAIVQKYENEVSQRSELVALKAKLVADINKNKENSRLGQVLKVKNSAPSTTPTTNPSPKSSAPTIIPKKNPSPKSSAPASNIVLPMTKGSSGKLTLAERENTHTGFKNKSSKSKSSIGRLSKNKSFKCKSPHHRLSKSKPSHHRASKSKSSSTHSKHSDNKPSKYQLAQTKLYDASELKTPPSPPPSPPPPSPPPPEPMEITPKVIERKHAYSTLYHVVQEQAPKTSRPENYFELNMYPIVFKGPYAMMKPTRAPNPTKRRVTSSDGDDAFHSSCKKIKR